MPTDAEMLREVAGIERDLSLRADRADALERAARVLEILTPEALAVSWCRCAGEGGGLAMEHIRGCPERTRLALREALR